MFQKQILFFIKTLIFTTSLLLVTSMQAQQTVNMTVTTDAVDPAAGEDVTFNVNLTRVGSVNLLGLAQDFSVLSENDQGEFVGSGWRFISGGGADEPQTKPDPGDLNSPAQPEGVFNVLYTAIPVDLSTFEQKTEISYSFVLRAPNPFTEKPVVITSLVRFRFEGDSSETEKNDCANNIAASTYNHFNQSRSNGSRKWRSIHL